MKTIDNRTSAERDFESFLASCDFFTVRREQFVVDADTASAREYADDTERWRYRAEYGDAEPAEPQPEKRRRYRFTPIQLEIAKAADAIRMAALIEQRKKTAAA